MIYIIGGEGLMDFFEISGQALLWRNHGETLRIEPWEPDSLRVRSVPMGELRDDGLRCWTPRLARMWKSR